MPNLGFLLMSLAKQLKAELNRKLVAHNLTVSQWALLAALARADTPLTAAVLANQLGMDKPTVSGIVRRLTAKAMLLEQPKADDHRARELTLTCSGLSAYQQCAAIADETMAEFLVPLNVEQRQQLTTLLVTLEGAAQHD